jgi:hypothetical protein
MTHHQELQSFPGTRRPLLYKNSKITLPALCLVPAGTHEVTVALNFVSGRAVERIAEWFNSSVDTVKLRKMIQWFSPSVKTVTDWKRNA